MVQINAYNNTHQQHFVVKPCASLQKPCITVGVCAQGGGCSINTLIMNNVNCKQQQVQEIINTKYMHTTTPPTNIYFIVKPCASAQKPWVTVGGCVSRGGGGII